MSVSFVGIVRCRHSSHFSLPSRSIVIKCAFFYQFIFSLFTLRIQFSLQWQNEHKIERIRAYIHCMQWNWAWNEEEESVKKCQRMIWMHRQMHYDLRSRMYKAIFSLDIIRTRTEYAEIERARFDILLNLIER